MTRPPKPRASDSLRAHVRRILRRSIARCLKNSSEADEGEIALKFGGSVEEFGTDAQCDAIARELFSMFSERCGGDEDNSEVLRRVRESAHAIASNVAAERRRCANVFEIAHRGGNLRDALRDALERGVADRARAKWRREVIVERHRALRREAKAIEDGDEAWERATATEAGREDMRAYAEAAAEVGNRAWVVSSLEWCVDAVGAYFGEAGVGVIRKRAVKFSWAIANGRRAKAIAKKNPATSLEDARERVALETPVASESGRSVKVLDVGSCWDYFNLHFKGPWPGTVEATTLACDLMPRVPSVLECDWLRVAFEDEDRVEDASVEGGSKHLAAVKTHGADALVFSLVLSYVPTPRQRGEMVRRARLALKNRGAGLLFIITPHSTDKGHCPHNALPVLKEWREVLNGLGFERVLYERQRSTHCLAFRTLGDGDEARAAEASPPELRIAFDAQVNDVNE